MIAAPLEPKVGAPRPGATTSSRPPTFSPMLQRTIRIVGWTILLGSVIFLGLRFIGNFQAVVELGFTIEMIMETALGAVAYGFSMFLTSAAWGVLLKGLTEQPVRWTQVVSAYGRSSIAKYLPGNVFHYAGRQVLGHAMGWPHTAMAAATLLETVLIIFVAALLAFFLRTPEMASLSFPVPLPLVLGGALCVVGSCWAALYNVPRLPWLRRFFDPRLMRRLALSPRLFVAMALYIVFFATFTLVLWAVLAEIEGGWPWPVLFKASGALVLSWLVGTVTPGAPGGIGVREAALVILLGPTLGEAVALAVALLLRLVTTAGELLYFGASVVVHKAWAR